jgi:hypothetical protein
MVSMREATCIISIRNNSKSGYFGSAYTIKLSPPAGLAR